MLTMTAYRLLIRSVVILLCCGVVVLLFGCTRSKNSPTLPDAHPDSWMDTESVDFHGVVALTQGVWSCAECHGSDWAGGKVGVSCLNCHTPETGSCTGCHGGYDGTSSPAPPYGLRGETDDTTLAVGAHREHLEGTDHAAAVPCDACHIVPVFAWDSSHFDFNLTQGVTPVDSIAELTWGGIAPAPGINWNRGTRTCSGTYCHGNFAGGNADNQPVWGASGQADCGSCHDQGDDPAKLGWKHEIHLTVGELSCTDCHHAVVDENLGFTDPSLHVNGRVDTLTRDPAVCATCHGEGSGSCTLCHGGVDNPSGAPPTGLRGESSSSSLAVGAHTRHLEGGDLADAFACSECHEVPAAFDAPGHLGADSIAELSWSALAGSGSHWDRESATCASVYCHGAFDGGETANTPVWTDANPAVCGSCHDVGDSPAALGWKHEIHLGDGGLQCADCHAAVVDQQLAIVGRGLHVNGVVDTLTRDPALCETCHGQGVASCTLCHGGVDNSTGAPPAGLRGETSPGALAVGAHTRHLEGGAIADAFACEECHTVPLAFSDPGHLGADSIAEVTWGTLPGHVAAWDRNNATCASVYCHGTFPGGNPANTPVWTDANQASCGSCHDVGADPAVLGWKHDLHVRTGGLACADCHASVVDLQNTISGRALHVNGVVDTLTRDPNLCETCHGEGTASCTLCHGGTDNLSGAPPAGLRGETSAGSLAVGAHTRHLEGGRLADAFACSECHTVPAAYTDPGHLDADSVAELTWGTLAGHESSWNRTSASCAGTYCHGNFAGGATGNVAVWTSSTEAACGSCHDVGADPASLGWKHEMHILTGGLTCADCHFSVVDQQQAITGLDLHVNGVTDTLTRDPAVCETCHGPGEGACTICHGGTDNQTGAPPLGLRGETATADRAVGAHTAHLSDGALADAFACSECHLVPAAYTDPGHIEADSIAELTWSPLAGHASVWDRDNATCAATYCHGNFDGGHNGNTPVWTEAGQAACGSCHDIGDDPIALGWKHEIHMTTANLECADCHAAVVDLDMDIVGFDLHVNGVPDTLTRDSTVCGVCHGPLGSTCTLCHGGTDNLTGAPPQGLHGETEPSALAVGAHTAHIAGGAIADAFLCSECHVVPSSYSDPGHIDADTIAELTWGPLAGHTSVWDRDNATCAGTYCHGEFTGGDAGNTPVWTGTGQAQCGSCHDIGDNPVSLGWSHEIHIATGGLACADCHFSVVDSQLQITGLNLHVNGVVDTLTRDHAVCETCHGEGTGACVLCHGGLDNATGAPPVSLHGDTATSVVAVGAHTRHLEGGLLSDAFDCSECHVVPLTFADPGHLGSDSIAELTWGVLAGDQSVWDHGSATCSGTYCHGGFGGGDGTNAPVWTGSNQAACGSCHDVGSDPSSLGWHHDVHITIGGLGCADCHFNVVDQADSVTARDLHVNGVADTLTRDPALCNTCHGVGTGSCTICHGGTDNQTGAPPRGLENETATTILAVGAHTIHLEGGQQADAFACSECHIVPESFADPGHFGADSTAELTWGLLAGHQSVWNPGTATCASTYCHGNFGGGDGTNAPVWTGSNQATCGSCHDVGSDPASLGWKHDVHVTTGGLDCADCHFSVVDQSNTITGLSLHVNGVVDTLTRDEAVCNTCHGVGTGSCSICHGGIDNQTGAPPRGLRGETATSALAVGAHTTHIEGGPQADAFSCSDCHVVPASFSDPGHLGADSIAELSWSVLAGSSSSWNRTNATCGSTYCHGNFGGGDGTNAPVWTGSNQAACGSCHDVGSDPASLGWKHDVHVTTGGLDCADCHFSVVDQSNTITGLSLHVNGVVDTLTRDEAVCNTCHGPGTGSCNICHGGVDNTTGAPPRGLRGETATSALAVGAHTTHMEGGTQADAFACQECHVVPSTFTDPGHIAADSIAELTWGTLAGVQSTWTRSAATCASTYCHGNFGGGDGSNTPVWTGSNQAACGSCHDVGSDPASLGWKHSVHVIVGNLDCADCHFSVVDQTNTITGLPLHVNGVIDTLTRDPAVCATCHDPSAANCVQCHGGIDNTTGAPPDGLRGETATSALAVGAHTTHMEGGTQADAFACTECHTAYATFADPGHWGADSIAEMSWSALSGLVNWNRGGATCASSYCHGNFSGGDGSNTPVWTGSNQAACGSCHDVGATPSLLGGRHDKHVRKENITCNRCHADVVNSGNTVIGLGLHVNGQNDIKFSPNVGSYSGGTCSNPGGCHGTENW